MDRSFFRELISKQILVLDGATGTEMQKRGMPLGVCPEKWVLENPQVLAEVQREYFGAGADLVYTFTFGGNRVKLEEFGLSTQVVEFNRELAKLSKEVAGTTGYVVGDLAPTGKFVTPFGEMPFETVVEIYKEQVRGLLEGGVDLFVIETMLDIQEARAALLAVRESCTLPVIVSMTFDETGRTLTGTDPVSALLTLQSLGADAVGCNCSTGPADMMRVIAAMKPYAKVPLLAKPNAGLPKLIAGKTVFEMTSVEFGSYVPGLIEVGVNLIGGCCGTTPAYIREVRQKSLGVTLKEIQPAEFSGVSSARKTVFFGAKHPVTIVGERINPTGKKKLQEELRGGKTTEVRRFALEQLEKGAAILDVNVGMSGIDEKAMMVELVGLLSQIVDAPLCLDSSSPEVLEAALRVYPGRALINSISGEQVKLEKLLPLAAKYGAMFILLPLNDQGIPEKVAGRIEIIKDVFCEAEKYGYAKEDLVVDGLVMTVSSDQQAAQETLKVIDWCAHEFGCNTIVGLSNVSFGLPERAWVNTAFFAMGIARGLTMAIANPSSEMLMNLKRACDVLTSNDQNSQAYLEHFAQSSTGDKGGTKREQSLLSSEERVFEAVLKGERDGIIELLEKAIGEGILPDKLVNEDLIPAISKVGQLFDEKKYFLPQLIQSAETMKKAFEYLEPLLKTSPAELVKNKTKILMATVKGDIHDIGKNIVSLMLKNYGFVIYDLGKDVAAEEIIAKAKEVNADVIGLSALMTTTMVEMKRVIQLAKVEALNCKFIIGGAVVNDQYAKEIGADGYASDAYSAVKLVQNLL